MFSLVCERDPELPGPARVTLIKGESEANGDAYAVDSAMVTRGTDTALAESAASEASKSVALLANVQALLGCTMEEVNPYFVLVFPIWAWRVCGVC